MTREQSGSVEAFSANWIGRKESDRYHFRRGNPDNQVQFAFQNHWRVFQGILGDIQAGRVLEVGCGRGSMSAFFADSGFESHMLDTSYDVLKIARDNFEADGIRGDYFCGDALALPYMPGSFDVVLSIGLFEHFSDIEQPLREQMRILKPGGTFLGYIVPERALSVQNVAAPINALLALGHNIAGALKSKSGEKKQQSKAPLYRNDYSSEAYLSILDEMQVASSGSFGLFPVPLVSHSPGFPFSLMHPASERALVRLWQFLLKPRFGSQRDPWTCSENWGLAFLVWAKKRVRIMMRAKSPETVLAIVPARGGSKGVHRKNLRLLQGKTLIEYTLRAALASQHITRLVVSTDDAEIAETVRSLGIEVPFLRPATLASDTASQMDVVLHAVEYFQTTEGILFDVVLLLQPTAPLRITADIDDALNMLLSTQADSVISFSPVEHNHPYYLYTITDGQPKPLLEVPTGISRRQDFPPIYVRNGAIYAVRSSVLLAQRSFYGKDMRAYIMPSDRSVNIDSEMDLVMAEYLLQQHESL